MKIDNNYYNNLLNDNNAMDKKESAYSSKISSQQLHQIALNNDGHGNDDKQIQMQMQIQQIQMQIQMQIQIQQMQRIQWIQQLQM